MTLTIDVPEELEIRLEEEARRKGVSKDDLVRVVLEESLLSAPQRCREPFESRIIATDLPVRDRTLEHEWIAKHQNEYEGQWVALDGDKLLAYGFDLKHVTKTAWDMGVDDALFVRAEASDDLPYVGM
jgi:hypothetical protein